MDPAASVRTELYYAAAKDGTRWYRDPVVDVDRIEQAPFQRFPGLHGNVPEQLNR